MSLARVFIALGALNAALAVVLGAFGAHALKARITPEALQVYHTAGSYHFVHALGLVLLGLAVAQLGESAWLRWSGWLMFAGIVLFCASLYLVSAAGLRGLAMVTPVGGALFVAAWVLFALGAWKGG
jgi:uncharacterized membrane protein YgdD (TMEM256/DUF423 family)